MRLIDADAFKKILSEHEMEHDKRRSFDDYAWGASNAYEHASDLLDEMPTVERPHGEWVFKNGKYRCSVCLEPCATFCMNEPRDNFCLYCGSDNRPRKRGLRAKMGLIDDAVDENPNFEYLKVGDTIYTQDNDKQGWTGKEENK